MLAGSSTMRLHTARNRSSRSTLTLPMLITRLPDREILAPQPQSLADQPHRIAASPVLSTRAHRPPARCRSAARARWLSHKWKSPGVRQDLETELRHAML